MPTIADVKKDRQFYTSFASLMEVLKSIAASQFHSLEKKIKTYPDFTHSLEGFLKGIDLNALQHPFARPEGAPQGILVITADAGLMGGVNYKLMMRTLDNMESIQDKLVVVGLQGQKFIRGTDVSLKTFPGIVDEQCFSQAQALRDYIFQEVLAKRMGAVKMIFPYAPSISSHQLLTWELIPCSLWHTARLPGMETPPLSSTLDPEIIMESSLEEIVEYVTYLWMGQKIFEALQFSRLAEHAARVIHLEESSQRVKDIEKKLKLKYFRIHHEIIDQQMRELFTARSLYA